jgi:hypothetical protein
MWLESAFTQAMLFEARRWEELRETEAQRWYTEAFMKAGAHVFFNGVERSAQEYLESLRRTIR